MALTCTGWQLPCLTGDMQQAVDMPTIIVISANANKILQFIFV